MKAITFFIVAVLGLVTAAAAETSATVTTERASSTISAERSGFAPGETTWFVFEQELREGWHVYWKNPGDSGLALEFSWTLPEGFQSGEINYPLPERIPVGPLANYGHHGSPVFMAPVKAPASAQIGDVIDVTLNATWLICEEICVPESASFNLVLPVEATPTIRAEMKAVADAARASAPAGIEGSAIFSATTTEVIVAIESSEQLSTTSSVVDSGYFFPNMEGLIEPAEPQTINIQNGNLVIGMKGGFALDPKTIETVAGLFVVGEGDKRKGFEVIAQRSNTPIAATTSGSTAPAQTSVNGTYSLSFLLLAAFFGGVILNVMPCVFPILFIKASSLVNSNAANLSTVRRHGVLYTLGVVSTFALLGGALLALRAGGEQLGWGFHLQSPPVVAFSAFVLFLVGLNLAGVFTIGDSLANTGSGLASKGGNVGAFFTGALAVVVAAPCIGPLLSAPMGAAVTLPPVAGMSIFVLMALGLAAPYLLISYIPAIGRILPRPGNWMKIFKQALAFPVFAAAAYFLWVLAQQTGDAGLARGFVGLLFVGLASWLFELSKGDGMRALLIRASAAIAAIVAIFAVGRLEIAETAGTNKGGYGAIEVVGFDPAMIEENQAKGQGVFVDFTAAWCVTCQFNKLTIFSKTSFTEAFKSSGVVFMSADWTRRDPQITKALEEHGANGVPLYVYYPPEGAPKVLSLPISERSVLDALG